MVTLNVESKNCAKWIFSLCRFQNSFPLNFPQLDSTRVKYWSYCIYSCCCCNLTGYFSFIRWLLILNITEPVSVETITAQSSQSYDQGGIKMILWRDSLQDVFVIVSFLLVGKGSCDPSIKKIASSLMHESSTFFTS